MKILHEVKMRKDFLAVFLVLATLFLATCSKDLSRNKAKNILEKYPDLINYYINKKFLMKTDYSPTFNVPLGTRVEYHNYEARQLLVALQNAGYITISEKSSETRLLTLYDIKYYWTISETEKLKPYIVAENENNLEVKLADVVVNEVTGITKSDNQAYVDYTTRVVPNPLSEIIPVNDYDRSQNRRHATFILYDDGWRLAR